MPPEVWVLLLLLRGANAPLAAAASACCLSICVERASERAREKKRRKEKREERREKRRARVSMMLVGSLKEDAAIRSTAQPSFVAGRQQSRVSHPVSLAHQVDQLELNGSAK